MFVPLCKFNLTPLNVCVPGLSLSVISTVCAEKLNIQITLQRKKKTQNSASGWVFFFWSPPHTPTHTPHTHTLSAMWFVFPHHICMWPLIGEESAALRILAVDDGQQHHDNHKEHQRGNCLKPERIRSHLITLSQALRVYFSTHFAHLKPVMSFLMECAYSLFLNVSPFLQSKFLRCV